MSNNKNNNKMGCIQSLRAIAAIGVIITHIYPVIKTTYDIDSYIFNMITTGFVDTGKIGVALFFVMCGYFLYNIKNKTKRKFIIDRIIRLYPEYWFSILCAVIFLGGYSIKQILINCTMLQIFFGEENILGLYWTLPIELTIYLGVFIVWNKMNSILFLKILFWAINFINIILSIIRFATKKAVPVAFGLLISWAMLGFFFRLYVEEELERKTIIVLFIIWISILLIISIFAYGFSINYQETWYRYFLSYFFAILLFIVFYYKKITNVYLEKIGDMSYSIYLMHPIAYLTAISIAKDNNWIVGTIMSFLFICVFSSIGYLLFEIKISSFIKEKINQICNKY